MYMQIYVQTRPTNKMLTFVDGKQMKFSWEIQFMNEIFQNWHKNFLMLVDLKDSSVTQKVLLI